MSLSINFHRVNQVKASNLETSFAINILGEDGYEGVTLYFEDSLHASAFARAICLAVDFPGTKYLPQANGAVNA